MTESFPVNELDTIFRDQLTRLDGAYAFYFRGEDGHEARFSNRGGEYRFKTASIIKVPIALGWLELERIGELDRRDTCDLDREPRVEGAGFMTHLVGRKIPYADVIQHMLATSDNWCTNAVIERIGMTRLNELWRDRFHFVDTHLGRKMMHRADSASGRDNWTTAADMVKWYAAVEALGAADRETLEGWMSACQDGNLFFRDFERSTDGFFHKTGGLADVANDWGFTRTKRFYLVTNEVRSKRLTRDVFGKIGSFLLES